MFFPLLVFASLPAFSVLVVVAYFHSPVKAALPAPGGVEGAAVWLKADQGVVVNGSNQVEQWLDQSASGLVTVEAQASHPTHTDPIDPSDAIKIVANGINFNPVVDFAGTLDRSLRGTASQSWNSVPDLTMFGVSQTEGATPGSLSGIFDTNGGWSSDHTTGRGLIASKPGSSFMIDGAGCSPGTTPASTLPILGRGVYVNTNTTAGGSTWLNGKKEVDTGPCAGGPGGPNFEVGGRTPGSPSRHNRVFNGNIPEVIAYKSALTDHQAQRIDSYLAIKYGITLNPVANLDYLASDGTTKAWDAAANAGYYNNVTGIGRDDNSALNQKQSESVNLQSIVTVGHGDIAADNATNSNNFAANNSFLMFGDDNGSATTWTTPSQPSLSNYNRLTRTWKAQKTGTVGALEISFDVNNPNANIPDPIYNYYLLNLTTGQATQLTSTDGNNYGVDNVTFNDGDIFTIGTFSTQYNVYYRKTVSPIQTSITPGQTFTYTVTAENRGNVPLTGLSFTDDLSDVIDDATYNNDVNSGGVGTPSWNGVDQISWTGDLAVGQTATITYSFTMNVPETGDGRLDNGIVSNGQGGNCTEDPAVDPDCMTTTPLPVVVSQKTLVSPANPKAGDIVNYQFVITNTGGAPAATVPVADDLAGVADDATYNNDAVATSGNLSYNTLTKRLNWSGNLAAAGNAGDSVTVTYSVTVHGADHLGDAILNNAIISPDCPNPPIFDSGDPDYRANCVTSTPVTAWMAVKTTTAADGIKPGDTADYTITVTNTGAVNLAGIDAPELDDNLTDVIDDADFDSNTAQATTGNVSYTEPTLHWTGSLNSGQTAIITYSATIKSLGSLGSGNLANAIGAGPMNCPTTPTSNSGDPTFSASCAVLASIDTTDPNAIPEPVNSGTPSDQGLADTGQNIFVYILSALTLIVGAAFIFYSRRTRSLLS